MRAFTTNRGPTSHAVWVVCASLTGWMDGWDGWMEDGSGMDG